MDYDGPSRGLRVARSVILEAIIRIQADCIGHATNFDGGEIIESLGDQVFIKYTLQHPEPWLTGMNTSSVDDSPPEENFVVPAHPNASLVGSGNGNSSLMASEKQVGQNLVATS